MSVYKLVKSKIKHATVGFKKNKINECNSLWIFRQ
jgi:hypothetical protein